MWVWFSILSQLQFVMLILLQSMSLSSCFSLSHYKLLINITSTFLWRLADPSPSIPKEDCIPLRFFEVLSLTFRSITLLIPDLPFQLDHHHWNQLTFAMQYFQSTTVWKAETKYWWDFSSFFISTSSMCLAQVDYHLWKLSFDNAFVAVLPSLD